MHAHPRNQPTDQTRVITSRGRGAFPPAGPSLGRRVLPLALITGTLLLAGCSSTDAGREDTVTTTGRASDPSNATSSTSGESSNSPAAEEQTIDTASEEPAVLEVRLLDAEADCEAILASGIIEAATDQDYLIAGSHSDSATALACSFTSRGSDAPIAVRIEVLYGGAHEPSASLPTIPEPEFDDPDFGPAFAQITPYPGGLSSSVSLSCHANTLGLSIQAAGVAGYDVVSDIKLVSTTENIGAHLCGGDWVMAGE